MNPHTTHLPSPQSGLENDDQYSVMQIRLGLESENKIPGISVYVPGLIREMGMIILALLTTQSYCGH